jgi:hypothetical protein
MPFGALQVRPGMGRPRRVRSHQSLIDTRMDQHILTSPGETKLGQVAPS